MPFSFDKPDVGCICSVPPGRQCCSCEQHALAASADTCFWELLLLLWPGRIRLLQAASCNPCLCCSPPQGRVPMMPCACTCGTQLAMTTAGSARSRTLTLSRPRPGAGEFRVQFCWVESCHLRSLGLGEDSSLCGVHSSRRKEKI